MTLIDSLRLVATWSLGPGSAATNSHRHEFADAKVGVLAGLLAGVEPAGWDQHGVPSGPAHGPALEVDLAVMRQARQREVPQHWSVLPPARATG